MQAELAGAGAASRKGWVVEENKWPVATCVRLRKVGEVTASGTWS